MFGDENTAAAVSAMLEKRNRQTSPGSGFLDLYSMLESRLSQLQTGEEVQEICDSLHATSVLERRMDGGANFTDVPVPVLLQIISYLDARDIGNLSQTNTMFNFLCDDHLLWKQLLESDKLKWSEVGHATNPSGLAASHDDITFKNIYLRCSPDTRPKERFNILQIPRLIKSYFPQQPPKVVFFGPGLDSDTSSIIRSILDMEENPFKNRGPFPAMFPGSIGTGFVIDVADGTSTHQMKMITLYSGTKKSRQISPLEDRSARSRLLERVSSEDESQEYQPRPSIKLLCQNVNAFVCVVESSQHLVSVSRCMEELNALLDRRWTPHTSPLLVLSCTPDQDTPRIPCVTIAEQLQLNSLVRPWKVVDAVVSDLHSLTPGIRWLIEAAQGTGAS